MQAPAPPVIAYPVDSSSAKIPSMGLDMDHGFLSMDMHGPASYTSDDVDLGGNFFSQLDSMIQAVKVESSALDSMRDKLKEVDNLRSQISAFTKRLIDADQSNLNLKAQLVKSQEAYSELKKQKAEVESSIVPIRQELNRTKEMLNKERTARQQLQQELVNTREQLAQAQRANESLNQECKAIPALNDSNEMLKSDLEKLRKRYKEEKSGMLKHIKFLESQARDVDALRGEVRGLAMRLMDLTSSSMGGNSNSNNNVAVSQSLPSTFIAGNAINLRSHHHTHNTHAHALNTASVASFSAMGSQSSDEDEDDDYSQENMYLPSSAPPGHTPPDLTQDGDYSFHDESMLNHSIESNVSLSSPANINNNNNSNNSNAQRVQQGMHSAPVGGEKKKKKVKRTTNASSGAPNMMQQLPSNALAYNLPRIR